MAAVDRFHISNMGSFTGGLVADHSGYVTVHSSPRYGKATEDQLRAWVDSGRTIAIRNAAQCELNNRRLLVWQKGKVND